MSKGKTCGKADVVMLVVAISHEQPLGVEGVKRNPWIGESRILRRREVCLVVVVRKRQRQLPRWVHVAEQNVRNRIACDDGPLYVTK